MSRPPPLLGPRGGVTGGGLSWCQLEPLSHLGVWRTTGVVVWVGPRDRYWLEIPSGFYSDLASVPNWAWPMLDCGPNHLASAGLVHDYVARIDAEIRLDVGRRVAPDLEQAAEVMGHVMEWSGIEASDRWKVRFAIMAETGYWRRRNVDWRPESVA